MPDQELLKRCLNCRFIRSSRAGFLYCKRGELPKECQIKRAKRRRSRRTVGAKRVPGAPGRHVVVTEEDAYEEGGG